jgi:hypothetical protein
MSSSEDSQLCFQHLQKLLDAVPEKRLELGVVAGCKPGILAGQLSVFRVREDVLGASYSELIVEAVNALPDLLGKHEHNRYQVDHGALPAIKSIDPAFRESMIREISLVLNMRLGARKGSMAIWGKLVWMNIEAHMQRSVRGLGALKVPTLPNVHEAEEDAYRTRLEAVLDFCCFVQSNGTADSVPNSSALDEMVSSWNRERNNQCLNN